MHKTISALMVLCALCGPVSALTITSNAPCNIFKEGSRVRLEIKDAQGAVSYRISDYFGSKIADGSTNVIDIAGLKPGWYEVKCKDSAGETSTSIGVVIDRGNAPLPEDGRVCTDVAGAWLVKGDSFKSLVQMIHLAGIPWVRERLSWGGTERERGNIDWGEYQTLADLYKAEGVHICQHWGDFPKWTQLAIKDNVSRGDLRDYYRYARAASSNFAHQIETWEIWNEPDGSLPYDFYAGMVKTAYLGLKDGNPRASVFLGSIARGVTNFTRGIYDSGVTDYFDTFNWHIYSKPDIYPGALASQLEQLKEFGASTRPVWVTEAGVVVKGTEGPSKLELNSENQHIQCQYMPRGAAMSLAAGNDKYFFFVLPNYTEGNIQWGALHPDMTPYPSFVALSAAANIIGQSSYLGEYKSGNNDVTAQVFSTPKGNVLVAWSDKESEIIVPTEKQTLHMANIFGQQSTISCPMGYARLKVGPDAVYLLDVGKSIESKLTGKPRPMGKLPKLNPSRVVLVGHANFPVMKEAGAYKLADQSVFDYVVDAYNFNDKASATGTVTLAAPEGWIVEDAKRNVGLGVMGRESLTFKVKPGSPGAESSRLIANGNFKNEKVAPTISSFIFDPGMVEPSERKSLDWTDASIWVKEASPVGTIMLTNLDANTLHFDFTFAGKGDKWAYPILRFQQPLNMSGYDGLAFDLNVPEDMGSTTMRIMFVESSGAHYIASTLPTIGKRRVVFLFQNLERLDFMGKDPNGHFDSDSISSIKLGCNAGSEHVAFDVSGFELVKFNNP
ncbi:hypothetical protein LLG46_01760 [bacterium]|nr:hypothetical protein [bacterium]